MDNKVDDIVIADRRVRENIDSAVGMWQKRVHCILTEDIAMKKLLARLVSRLLTDDQNHIR